MAKEEKGGGGEVVWDDSALVQAFDHSISTYLAMHTNKFEEAPSEEEKQVDDTDEREPLSTELTKNVKQDDSKIDLVNSASETFVPFNEDTLAAEPLHPVNNLHMSDFQQNSSDFIDADKNVDNFSYQQNVEINEFLKQYYELEEQRQKVLQQLQQAGYWNYQTPDQSSAYQEQQLPSYGAAQSGPHCSPYVPRSCSCLTVPLIPISCGVNGQACGASSCLPPPSATSCSDSLACDQCPAKSGIYATGESSSADGAARAGTIAAGSLFDFIRTQIYGNSGSFDSKEKESISVSEHKLAQDINLDGDLATVLNAWYAAGFHTGRYLTLQSMKNAQ